MPPSLSPGEIFQKVLVTTLALAAGFIPLVSCSEQAGPQAGGWWKPITSGSLLHSAFDPRTNEWSVAGECSRAVDPAIGGMVMTATNESGMVIQGLAPVTGDREIRARVRLRTHLAPSVYASISAAKKNENDPGLSITMASGKGGGFIQCAPSLGGQPFHNIAGLTSNLNWNCPFHNDFLYYCRAYPQALPGWEQAYREQIEEDMARIPDEETKWVEVRAELRKGSVAVWMEDRLVAWKNDPSFSPDGTMGLNLSAGTQVASFTSAPLAPATEGFLPVPLSGYHNAIALTGGSPVKSEFLPPAGRVVMVKDVPFVFSGVNSEGNDHIDVGQSLFREANLIGYLPAGPNTGAWCGATRRDPARIQLRIRNGQYDALYVIAASEDKKNSVPLLSAMFYRPDAGYSETFETNVPLAGADSSDATPLPVMLGNGRKANLWLVKIPLDPARLTSFGDLDIIEIELTKKVESCRNYPDPITYGWHQAGLPSAVHVYALTLGEVPVGFSWEPDQFGHVWIAPKVPSYTAKLTNHTDADKIGKLTVTTKSYDGTEEPSPQEFPVTIPKGQAVTVKVSLPVKLNGYHDVIATLDVGGKQWTEKRSLTRLAPDTRSVKWTEGKGVMFGYWGYHGGHHTPKGELTTDLMTKAGARQYVMAARPPDTELVRKHWGRVTSSPYLVFPQEWAGEEKLDPVKVGTFRKEILANMKEWDKDIPVNQRADNITFYPEAHISTRLTCGNYPEYWNGEPLVYTDEEKKRLRMFMETSRIAAELLRKAYPERKLLLEYGDPLFPVPLLRAGFPTNLVDGTGLDVPVFERLPEMQLRDIAIHRLYQLRKEYEKVGITKPRFYAVEGSFVPTEPGSCTWREQMDLYSRWSLIDMAYGVDRFYSGWCAFDCGDYYGAEHYGGCGIQRRIPFCDPKPAYAAYATTTDKLNEANFDGWVKTGSLTTFCLRFKHPKRGLIYALWTLRGKRDVTLTLKADAKAGVTDSMNNTKAVASKDKKITVSTDPSVIYVTAAEILSGNVEAPDHSEPKPAAGAVQVADLGDGSWKYTSKRDMVYEKNHFSFDPAAGKFTATVGNDPEKGPVLVSKLEKQDKVRELMPWYNVLKPSKPIQLAGAPSHIGLWVKGASDWGRVVYILRDNKGERWISIGTKDDYNCDDPHSWNSFNFDGWRYLRFELPGHRGWDNFRRMGTTWWGSSATAACSPTGKPEGDNIVDLPLTLEEMIVEQRSHILYVNDVQPVASDTVALGKMFVEYENPGDATTEAVELSRLRMPKPKDVPDLKNPIAQMQKEGVGAPTKLLRLAPPEHMYDGTRMRAHFTEVAGAKAHHLWVAPYEDGRGAVDLVPTGIKTGELVTGLRPGVKLYYWITYEDADGKMSKPSPVHTEITVDNFKEK